MSEPPTGHRVLPHTADVIVEAWAPTFAACCAEAADALIGLCVDGNGCTTVDAHHVVVDATAADSMLLAVLDEVIFVLDTMAAVPVGATTHARENGGMDLVLDLAARDCVVQAGSTPKAVSHSGLEVDVGPERTRCTFLVDV